MMDTARGLRWFGIALGIVAACGGDDGTTGVTTGFPAEQKLSTLTDDEAKQACRSINGGVTAAITPTAYARVGCVPLALQASSMETASSSVTVDVNKCQELVDACVEKNKAQAEETLESGTEEECSTASSTDLAGCDATIGEYEACMNGLLDQLQRIIAEMTCQNAEKLTSATYKLEGPDPDKVAQCQSLKSKCPDSDLGID